MKYLLMICMLTFTFAAFAAGPEPPGIDVTTSSVTIDTTVADIEKGVILSTCTDQCHIKAPGGCGYTRGFFNGGEICRVNDVNPKVKKVGSGATKAPAIPVMMLRLKQMPKVAPYKLTVVVGCLLLDPSALQGVPVDELRALSYLSHGARCEPPPKP